MRPRALSLALALCLAAAPAGASTYLLDNARHHIGDGLFAPYSADGERMHQTTIGHKYALAFCLTAPSRIQLAVAEVMGIEDGNSGSTWLAVPLSGGLALPYVVYKQECCGADLAVRPLTPQGPGEPTALGRLRAEHNGAGYRSEWSPPLAGGLYLLTVESRPVPWTVPGDMDDIEFLGIGVAAEEPGAAVSPVGRAVIYRERFPLDAVPPLPCPP